CVHVDASVEQHGDSDEPTGHDHDVEPLRYLQTQSETKESDGWAELMQRCACHQGCESQEDRDERGEATVRRNHRQLRADIAWRRDIVVEGDWIRRPGRRNKIAQRLMT